MFDGLTRRVFLVAVGLGGWLNWLRSDAAEPDVATDSGADKDLEVFGNSFTIRLMPFHRDVSCPGCEQRYPLATVYHEPSFEYKWDIPVMTATCPNCSHRGVWHGWKRPPHDCCTGEPSRIKRLNPLEMQIAYNPFRDDLDYIWDIPAVLRQQLREGRLFHMERVPWEVVQAVATNQNLLLTPGSVTHKRAQETLGGCYNRGWGLPKDMSGYNPGDSLDQYFERISRKG